MTLYPLAEDKQNTKDSIRPNRSDLGTNPKGQPIHGKGNLNILTVVSVSWLLQNDQSPTQTQIENFRRTWCRGRREIHLRLAFALKPGVHPFFVRNCQRNAYQAPCMAPGPCIFCKSGITSTYSALSTITD